MTHPYAELEDLDVWRALDRELASLEGNRDLELSTGRPFVIGALARRLLDEGLVLARKPPESRAPARANDGAATTAAVIVRVAGAMLVLPALLGMVLQLAILTKNLGGSLELNGAAVGMLGFLIYLLPGLLLIWFARPIGRVVARGL